MVPPTDSSTTLSLSLLDELILMLLNEESGYFYQVPGWNLNCAVIGAALAELSLLHHIDTDPESLFVVDGTATGDSILDPILSEIANEPVQHSAQYWIERLAPRAESVIDSTLERLVHLGVLEHHDGEFWTLTHAAQQGELFRDPSQGSTVQFVKTRISNFIFSREIPEPRDIIIICLVNTCDVLRFMFRLDEDAETRIRFICNMDLIGRALAAAVAWSIAGPALRRSSLRREIPSVSLRKLLLNRHLRRGNIPALFAELTQEYGPVFQIRPPFAEPLLFVSGPEVNYWVHKRGRMYLRSKDYFDDFAKLYGASGLLPGLDGAEHFRLRKALQSAYSRERLASQLDKLLLHARTHMATWKVGDSFPAANMCRMMINAQLSPLMLSIDSQDLMDDMQKYKERALTIHVMKAMPKFMLKTPGMRRRSRLTEELVERVLTTHTPAQRAGKSRGLADDLLSLNASDPLMMPESNLSFVFSAALIASVYLGDAFSFTVYAMASQPELYEQIRREADILFDNGDPMREDFTPETIDVTHRFLMECLRMYPIVPMSIRNVMNSCTIEGYDLPVGSRLHIAQTASHFMDDVFPEPFTFDIDRYLPPRNEHHSHGYAPYGLGTHTCLGSQWMMLQLAVNVLMLAHYYDIEVSPSNYKLRFSPIPSMKPNKKLKFRIAGQRRPLPV